MRAIRLVAAGDAMLSPAVTRRLIDHVADDGLATREAGNRVQIALLAHDAGVA